mgnify:CR=1 FL=1
MSKIPEHLTDEEVDDWIERESRRQNDAVLEEMKKDTYWPRIEKLRQAKEIMYSLANEEKREGYTDSIFEDIAMSIEQQYQFYYDDLYSCVASFMYKQHDYVEDDGHYDYRYRGC